MNNRDLKYGIILFACFVLYFLVMSINDYYLNYTLRIGNGVFHVIIIYLAIRSYHNSEDGKDNFNYLSGFAAGFKPSIMGTVLFSIFLFFYLLFNESFLNALKVATPLGNYITPVTASVVILFEGLAISVMLSYIIMRIVDNQYDENYIPERTKLKESK